MSNDLWAGNAGIGPSAAMVWTQVTAPSSSPKTTSSSPGARSMSAFSGDSMGRLWLFGGYGFDTATNIGDLNDLWVYTPGARGSAGQWISASISGSNLVNQSSTGLTPGSCAKNSVNAYPSARYAAVSWMDNNGHFWLFGGNGYGSPGVTNQVPWADSFGYMNDLWEYVPPATGVANGTWTCLTGDTQAFDPLHPSALNGSPPPRDGASGWTDSNGNLWLFGGTGLNGALNDLWMYSPSSGTWTSVSAGASGSPPPRWGAASWTDSKHDFWLSGGATGGAPFSYSAPTGVFNDYWEYKPAAGTWTLIGGSASAVPTSGVTSPATAPGARYGASAWPSSAFPEFWLFGGWGYSPSQPFPTYLNDTWNVTGVVY
ncbi:MAG: kelch repeat-containing protein [Steroidobacteraceae bacterium]